MEEEKNKNSDSTQNVVMAKQDKQGWVPNVQFHSNWFDEGFSNYTFMTPDP